MIFERRSVIEIVLFFVWTAGILYGSLAPSNDLPPMGWLTRIPYYDKLIHFGFYLGQVVWLTLWLRPSRQNRIWVAVPCIVFSGFIELVQGEFFARSADWTDFAANSLGALLGVPLTLLIERIFSRRKIAARQQNHIESEHP